MFVTPCKVSSKEGSGCGPTYKGQGGKRGAWVGGIFNEEVDKQDVGPLGREIRRCVTNAVCSAGCKCRCCAECELDSKADDCACMLEGNSVCWEGGEFGGHWRGI